jgi:farnesyl-diphosphate farnesyltransferase
MVVFSATGNELEVCRARLPRVSRTFALTIPELPGPLADSVTVAYLLCRVADDIEDDPRLAAGQRHALFALFREVLDGGDPEAVSAAWPVRDALAADLPAIVGAFRALPAAHRIAIDACLREMIDGMEAAGDRPAVGGVVHVCDDLADLERYCHFVAGTVGILLTRLFGDAVGGFGGPAREAQGRRFGLGLQLTNILRDHPEDLERGACFVPPAWLAGGRLTERGLREGVSLALVHLDAAPAYIAALPTAAGGMRRFCLWAAWIALATLREVALRPHDGARISREEVAEILRFTTRYATDDAALAKDWAAMRAGVLAALASRSVRAERHAWLP